MIDGKLWMPEVAKATHYHAYWVQPGLGQRNEKNLQARRPCLLSPAATGATAPMSRPGAMRRRPKKKPPRKRPSRRVSHSLEWLRSRRAGVNAPKRCANSAFRFQPCAAQMARITNIRFGLPGEPTMVRLRPRRVDCGRGCPAAIRPEQSYNVGTISGGQVGHRRRMAHAARHSRLRLPDRRDRLRAALRAWPVPDADVVGLRLEPRRVRAGAGDPDSGLGHRATLRRRHRRPLRRPSRARRPAPCSTAPASR